MFSVDCLSSELAFYCAALQMHMVEWAVVDAFGRHAQLAVALARSGGLQRLIDEAHRLRSTGQQAAVRVAPCRHLQLPANECLTIQCQSC